MTGTDIVADVEELCSTAARITAGGPLAERVAEVGERRLAQVGAGGQPLGELPQLPRPDASGGRPRGGPVKYYQANSLSQLNAALSAISRRR